MSRQLYVFKIGSSSIIEKSGFNLERITQFGYDIMKMKYEKGTDSILVISGAIKAGMLRRGLDPDDPKEKPTDKGSLQSLAREGQTDLMNAYREGLGKGSKKYLEERKKRENAGYTDKEVLSAAQFLVTYHNLEDRVESENIKQGLQRDVADDYSIQPCVNYNDGVDPTEADRDNDRLGAKISLIAGADKYIILTDVDGLYDGDRSNQDNLVKVVPCITPEIKAMCGDGGNGVGSMRTKIEAAKLLEHKDIEAIIGNAKLGLYALAFENVDKTVFFKKAA